MDRHRRRLRRRRGPAVPDRLASTANGIVTLTAPAQTDRLGNTGAAGSVTVRVDKASPTITAAADQERRRHHDRHLHLLRLQLRRRRASGIATCLADGSTTNSKTVQPGVTVTGTATDKAGNTAPRRSTAPAGDTTAPPLSGAPTTQPNGDGWYKGDVDDPLDGRRPRVRHPDRAGRHHDHR